MVTKLRKSKSVYYAAITGMAGLFSTMYILCVECLIFMEEHHYNYEFDLFSNGGLINYAEYWFFDLWFLFPLSILLVGLFAGLFFFSHAAIKIRYVEWNLFWIGISVGVMSAYGYYAVNRKLPDLYYEWISYHTYSLRKECVISGMLFLPVCFLFLVCLANIIRCIQYKTFRQNLLCYKGICMLMQNWGLRKKTLVSMFLIFVAGSIGMSVLLRCFRYEDAIVPMLLVLFLLFFIVCVFVVQEMGKYMQISAEAVRLSERLKVELITNISHDLKTPLSAIIGYGELLQQKQLEKDAAELVARINRKSYRLKEMLTDVMELSKVSAGVIQGKREPLNIIKLLEQSIGEMEDLFTQSGLELRREYAQDAVYIESDGAMMHRVFQNLIENALKYALKGSRIYIYVTIESLVEIRIVNTAAYEMTFDKNRITESFVRGEESRAGEGNGLGLAIASTYTNACGGTFDITVLGDQFQAILTFERYLKE